MGEINRDGPTISCLVRQPYHQLCTPAQLSLNSITHGTQLQRCLPDLVPKHESQRRCQPSRRLWPGTAAAIHGGTVQRRRSGALESFRGSPQSGKSSLLLTNLKHDRVKQRLFFTLAGKRMKKESQQNFGWPSCCEYVTFCTCADVCACLTYLH